ncbi:hypothetical protein BJV78DRAFT_370620 [Lactifluus subvellereus]|nr:hypothetical protein BJV78DRAFT_370620 [Lactifluus subvellereus]
MGQSIALTTLDWIAGALLTIALYWIGLYESIDAKSWEWFFHVDLAHSISYSAKRFIGGVAGVLFALHGTLTITALSSLPVFLLAHFVSHVSLDIWLAAHICLTSCVLFFWLRTRRLRAGARARKYRRISSKPTDWCFSCGKPRGSARWVLYWASSVEWLSSGRRSAYFTLFSHANQSPSRKPDVGL